MPRQPIYHGDYFPGNAADARKVFNGGSSSSDSGVEIETAWDLLTRGQNLGKAVPISFANAGNGNLPSQQGSAEILRIAPKTGGQENKRTVQAVITLSPPQIIPSGQLNLPLGGQQDSIDVVQAGNTFVNGRMGGQVANATPIDGFAMRMPWATAIIEWGIGSVMNRAECDIVNGLTLGLTFSHLVVCAAIQRNAVNTSSDGTYVIGANVGPGYPRSNSAQLSISVGGVANGAESPIFTVPRFAKSVRLAMTDGAGTVGNGTIRFRSESANATTMAEFLATANNPIPIPIINGANYFSIIGGYVGVSFPDPIYTAIFDLAL